MTATAYSGGHPVAWDGSYWRYTDGEPDGSRPCAHCGLAEVLLEVTILPHLSHDGQQRQAVKGVDACIAGVVRALNDGGVTTTSSCCGHGRNDGSVLLADGRELLIREAGCRAVGARDSTADDFKPSSKGVSEMTRGAASKATRRSFRPALLLL